MPARPSGAAADCWTTCANSWESRRSPRLVVGANCPGANATLWPAVKDTLRNSGKYGIISVDNEDLTASFNIGGTLTGKRVNSVVLNTKPEGCEMQVQTAFSGLVNNDEGDFKKRVDASLEKLKTTSPGAATAAPVAAPSKTDDTKKPEGPKN